MRSDDSITQKDMLDYAWKYFAYHAEQRIKNFNFFLLFLTAAITGIIGNVKYLNKPMFPLTAGFTLIILVFLFWKLDRRQRDLIHVGEDALREVESGFQIIPNMLFTESKTRTDKKKKSPTYFTSTKCFNSIFAIVFLSRFLGVIRGTQLYLFPNF